MMIMIFIIKMLTTVVLLIVLISIIIVSINKYKKLNSGRTVASSVFMIRVFYHVLLLLLWPRAVQVDFIVVYVL